MTVLVNRTDIFESTKLAPLVPIKFIRDRPVGSHLIWSQHTQNLELQIFMVSAKVNKCHNILVTYLLDYTIWGMVSIILEDSSGANEWLVVVLFEG